MKIISLIAVMVSLLSFSPCFSDPKASLVEYGLKTEKELNDQFKQYIKKVPSEKGKIGYLDFKKGHFIDQSSYLYVKEAFGFFKREQVAFVVVHLDCLGGSFFPTIKIADLFQKFDVNQKVPLIAYINDSAIGSGAMLAYACRFIAVSENAYMGGRLPDQKIMIQTFPENLLPYIFNEYSNLAAFYGRDPVIAEAMADLEMIVVEREGKLIGFYNKMDVNLEGDKQDVIIAADRQILTLSGQQLIKYGIADFLVKDQGVFKASKGSLFDAIALSSQAYLHQYSLWPLSLFSNWKLSLISFLTRPYVSAFLLFIAIVSLYLQIRASRLGIYTLTSFFALLAVVITSLTIDSLSWIEMLFLVVGVVIIVVDCVIVKGSNFALFFGVGLTVFGLFMMLLPGFEKFSLLDFEAFSFAAGSLLRRLVVLFSALIASVVTIGFFERQEKRKKENESASLKEDKEFIGSSMQVHVGQEGVAYNSLRPIGKVIIEDVLYEAKSVDEKVILKKTPIMVVEIKENVLIVKSKED